MSNLKSEASLLHLEYKFGHSKKKKKEKKRLTQAVPGVSCPDLFLF